MDVRVIGIGGGTASGKTTLAAALAQALGDQAVLVVHDRYYRTLPAFHAHDPSTFNFDHPESLETTRLVADLDRLRAGARASLPRYDFRTHSRELVEEDVDPRPLIIVEGILVLSDAELRRRFDLSVFVDTPDDVRLLRRLRRDIAERGRTVDDVLAQYERTVRPMHEQFVRPSRDHAQVVLDGTHPVPDLVTRMRAELRC
jgi:uridine kinase